MNLCVLMAAVSVAMITESRMRRLHSCDSPAQTLAVSPPHRFPISRRRGSIHTDQADRSNFQPITVNLA